MLLKYGVSHGRNLVRVLGVRHVFLTFNTIWI